MNALKPIFGTLAFTALLFGCGKNEAVKATEDMAAAVCACKDLACAQKVSQEQAEKLMKMKDAKGSQADADAIKKAGEKAADCMKKIATDSIKVMKPAEMEAPKTDAPAPATEAPATEAAAPVTEAAAPGTEAAAPGTDAPAGDAPAGDAPAGDAP